MPKEYLNFAKQIDLYYLLQGLTTAQKISKYNSYVGKYVRWYMPVIDVKDKYVIFTENTPRDVYLYGIDESKLMSLKKSQRVLFEGMIGEVSDSSIQYDNYLISLNLQNGRIYNALDGLNGYIQLVKSDGTVIFKSVTSGVITVYPDGSLNPQ